MEYRSSSHRRGLCDGRLVPNPITFLRDWLLYTQLPVVIRQTGPVVSASGWEWAYINITLGPESLAYLRILRSSKGHLPPQCPQKLPIPRRSNLCSNGTKGSRKETWPLSRSHCTRIIATQPTRDLSAGQSKPERSGLGISRMFSAFGPTIR